MHPNDPRVTIDWLKTPTRGQMFGHLMAKFGLQKGKYLPLQRATESRSYQVRQVPVVADVISRPTPNKVWFGG